jgi:predicted ATPase
VGGTTNKAGTGKEEVVVHGVDYGMAAHATKEQEQEEEKENDPEGSTASHTPPLSPPLLKGHNGTNNFNTCVSWKWYSEEVILQSTACSDVAQMVTETILSLPPEQQYVLKVGVCLGANFDKYTLHEVCQDAGVITKTLNDAKEKGILSSSTSSSSTTCETACSKDSMNTGGDSGTSNKPQTWTSCSFSTAYNGGIKQHGWRFTHDMIHHSVYSLIDEPH